MADTFGVLDLEGIKGESQRFENHLDVMNFVVSATNDNTTTRGTGQGKAAGMIHDIPVTANYCGASIELLDRVAHGNKVVAKGSLKQYTGNAEDPFLKVTYEMEEIHISRFDHHGDTVSFLISPTRIRYIYTQQNADGSAGSKVTGGFDRKTLKPWA